MSIAKQLGYKSAVYWYNTYRKEWELGFYTHETEMNGIVYAQCARHCIECEKIKIVSLGD